MSLATLIKLKLVGTFALFLGLLIWQWLSVRRTLRRDRGKSGGDLRPMRIVDGSDPHRLQVGSGMVGRDEQMILSERDSLRVLNLLQNPPEPTAALLRAAKADRSAA